MDHTDTTQWNLAQLNIAKLRAPLDSPLLEGFVSELDRINTLADNAPGFVWRLHNTDGTVPDAGPIGDEHVVNLSVWANRDDLFNYVFKTAHVGIMRQKGQWFSPLPNAHLVCWWIRKGHIPDQTEALEKLMLLRRSGPTPDAFTLKKHWPAPT